MGNNATARLTRHEIRAHFDAVVIAHGHTPPDGESTDLREVPFRSLDFSELALRIEDEIGAELNFDAPGLRAVRTVGDVLDLLETLQAA